MDRLGHSQIQTTQKYLRMVLKQYYQYKAQAEAAR